MVVERAGFIGHNNVLKSSKETTGLLNETEDRPREGLLQFWLVWWELRLFG